MEEEDDSSTNACDLNPGGMVKGKEEVKEKGKEEDEMETDMEVEEVIEEEESEFETDEEVQQVVGRGFKSRSREKQREQKEIFEEEEEDGDDENFNSFLSMKELSHHEWLLKNPRPPWVKAKTCGDGVSINSDASPTEPMTGVTTTMTGVQRQVIFDEKKLGSS
ncbi:hypothetical protein Tco_0343199 [Tanacetum coccineum]